MFHQSVESAARLLARRLEDHGSRRISERDQPGYLALDKCMVIESWDGGRGHKGENMFAYGPDDKSWHGLFADNQGRVHIFADGKVAPGAAEFSGPSWGPNGDTVLNRVRIVSTGPDNVEQVWEKSSDKGATWKTEFRGEYSRRKP